MESIANKTKNSNFIENLVEHLFISEILQEAWIKRNIKLEVLRSEVDDSGYDVVLTYDNITRYIQLKTTEYKGKTSKQKINIALARKENACIIWIVRKIQSSNNRYEFEYLYFGNKVGEEFPNMEGFKIAKHTKGNKDGEKKLRENIREIPKFKFVKYNNSSDLFDCIFS